MEEIQLPSENSCQQEPSSCHSNISSTPNLDITDDRLDKLEHSVQQLTSTSFPNVSYHHEGALDASTTTADDRLKRLEDILTALTKSVINKNISNYSPAECNVDKVQDEPSKTMITVKKKNTSHLPSLYALLTIVIKILCHSI